MINNDNECQPYVVECINKRRKLLVQSSSSLDQENIFQRLLDELVEEIFFRLPCSKSVIQCKSVCKHWDALISNPSFVRRFIASKISCRMHLDDKQMGRRADTHYENDFSMFDTDMDKGERSFVAVAHNTYKDGWKGMIMHLKDPLSNIHNVSFSRLPCLAAENSTLAIAGACNDLLLYCRHEHKRYEYYICNLQTRQWLLLPPCPFYHGNNYTINGFACDPYYSCESGTFDCNMILNDGYRFCVVVVENTKRGSSEYNAHLLSSNCSSRQWTKIVLSLPKHCSPLNTRSFVFAGVTHFLSVEGIIVFDPYKDSEVLNGTIHCRLIALPSGFRFGNECFGLRQGHLQLSSFSWSEDRVFSSWVLKNYESGEWSLQHKIVKYEWMPREPISSRYRDKDLWPGHVLCQHPTKPNLIYVLGVDATHLLLCDASERTMEVASGKLKRQLRISHCFDSFPSLLPVWPTPLPKLG